MDPNTPPIAAGDDPISKSALIRGIIACCIAALPVGSVIAIVMGIGARRRARLGREAIEASGGALRGKGAYIAGNICGIVAIVLGAIMTFYWGIVVVAALGAVLG